MTDPAKAFENPGAMETAHFLRRFADLMSNGQNSQYLLRAAELLESLTATVSTASNEEQLRQYKYDTLSQHSDALEAECERLRDDIEGHVQVTGMVLSERDELKAALAARETELLDLHGVLKSEQDQLAAISETHEAGLAGFRVAFEQERIALIATADARSQEIDLLRDQFERESAELSSKMMTREGQWSELRIAGERERDELHALIKAGESELAGVRADSARDRAALVERIEALESKRAELRSSFDRISQLNSQSMETAGGSGAPSAFGGQDPVQPGNGELAAKETEIVVPKDTLRQARAQFVFLAAECVRRGDVATQAMCELGAHAMDLALAEDESVDALPVDEVALSILKLRDLTWPERAKSVGSIG